MPLDFLAGTARYFTEDGTSVQLKELKNGVYHGFIIRDKDGVNKNCQKCGGEGRYLPNPPILYETDTIDEIQDSIEMAKCICPDCKSLRVIYDQAGNAIKPDDRKLDLVRGDIPYAKPRE